MKHRIYSHLLKVFSLIWAGQLWAKLPSIPAELPKPNPFYQLNRNSMRIDVGLNKSLEAFIERNGNDIASVVMVDVKTGSIIALAQGKHPYLWNSPTHTALYEGFPAASIFKTVPATALIDLGYLDPDKEIGLFGGCSKIHSNEQWVLDSPSRILSPISLKMAFARSCNGFFAKIGVTQLGLGVIDQYAHSYGWGQKIPVDFSLKSSPIHSPEPEHASLQTIGKFSAGFGQVGMSAVHAAWIFQTIAKDGIPGELRLFQGVQPIETQSSKPLFKKETAYQLRQIMNQTVLSGSGSSAFRQKRYRHLIPYVGGKTGTLTGSAPRGLTTWFVGLMPYDHPQVVVAAVVVAGEHWKMRGSHLAAEAFYLWEHDRDRIAKK